MFGFRRLPYILETYDESGKLEGSVRVKDNRVPREGESLFLDKIKEGYGLDRSEYLVKSVQTFIEVGRRTQGGNLMYSKNSRKIVIAHRVPEEDKKLVFDKKL